MIIPKKGKFGAGANKGGTSGNHRKVDGQLQFFCWQHGWVNVETRNQGCPLCRSNPHRIGGVTYRHYNMTVQKTLT